MNPLYGKTRIAQETMHRLLPQPRISQS